MQIHVNNISSSKRIFRYRLCYVGTAGPAVKLHPGESSSLLYDCALATSRRRTDRLTLTVGMKVKGPLWGSWGMRASQSECWKNLV